MSKIPKVIYQTWKTKNIDAKLQNVINNIQKLNPNYKIVFFDDDDIELWIKNTFENDTTIYDTYKKLKVGAARADFWRYLIMYMNGGIYLDIDSNINKPLDLLINNNDQAILSREKNSGTNYFVQWCLMFAPKHPILLRAINICIYNINNRTTNWLPDLTGPGVFTIAINDIIKKIYKLNIKKQNLFDLSDSVLNNLFNNDKNNVTFRFYGKDYEDFCSYDNGCKEVILENSTYWKDDKEVFT